MFALLLPLRGGEGRTLPAIANANLKIGLMIEELELLTKQLEQIESAMELALADTGMPNSKPR